MIVRKLLEGLAREWAGRNDLTFTGLESDDDRDPLVRCFFRHPTRGPFYLDINLTAELLRDPAEVRDFVPRWWDDAYRHLLTRKR